MLSLKSIVSPFFRLYNLPSSYKAVFIGIIWYQLSIENNF